MAVHDHQVVLATGQNDIVILGGELLHVVLHSLQVMRLGHDLLLFECLHLLLDEVVKFLMSLLPLFPSLSLLSGYFPYYVAYLGAVYVMFVCGSHCFEGF